MVNLFCDLISQTYQKFIVGWFVFRNDPRKQNCGEYCVRLKPVPNAG